ncbi:hypothetical protein SAMN04487971_11280 [Paracoccus chinensis]|uniref:Uncharacterized protein n=1 Tax=Paracoccus chinensis TaxID=525640 RepID=A0A1G9KUJ3_9RHOB|nr:hypothetical protein SAMN04487971_11280 [Paracoccus chinensis]
MRSAYEFTLPPITSGTQTKVMGFAFHPQFGQGSDQPFVCLTYMDEARTDPSRSDKADSYCRTFNKVVHLDYDQATGRLSHLIDVLTGIPANNDQNSGRTRKAPSSTPGATLSAGHHPQGCWP